jgi:hypothetical protein
MGEMGNTFNILIGKSEVKKLLKKPRPREEKNIKIYRREVECAE